MMVEEGSHGESDGLREGMMPYLLFLLGGDGRDPSTSPKVTFICAQGCSQ